MGAESFTGIYREIARAISVDVAVEMYNLFRGQQIIFPQRLYDQDFIVTYVKENYNGHNIRELSHMFNYSDRRIRQIIRQIRSENVTSDTDTDEGEENIWSG